ncbi:hypothetical protein HZH68_016195 [Vespula germanica]|uniref:Uncharacterized protein n=1 Tax=Vespula germanica TaxID=30212 RepID=A0A834MPT7_VESGE|nr:hypothetical protein HZH68_016195 [Vespula germanica]
MATTKFKGYGCYKRMTSMTDEIDFVVWIICQDILWDVRKEEEGEKADTGDEGVKGEGKDNEFTLVVDSIDDRFYLDADDFADKFKSNHTDVGL